MSQRILIVGAGANQAGIIAKARACGLFTIAMDGNPQAPGLALADAADAADICDAGQVARVARAHRAQGIYPAAEWSVESVAAAAQALGLPGIAPQVAERVRDKFAMRQALAAANIPVPGFRAVHTPDEADEAAQALGLPVIVKPCDGNASRGVQRLDYIEDMPLAFAQARKHSRKGVVLIEQFVEGEEFNVDGLVHAGQYTLGGITGKERSEPPFRFDWGIYMPPLLDSAVQQSIADAAAGALRAIGLQSGTTHIEIILSPAGPRIVEMAGRPGGGRIPSDLIPLAYGTDYVADSLRIALGEAPREQRRFERGVALYWIPTHSGVVTAIEGLDDARAVAGVVDVVMTAKPGDTLGHIVDCASRDAVGYVLAAGEDAAKAVHAAKAAARCCRVITTSTMN